MIPPRIEQTDTHTESNKPRLLGVSALSNKPLKQSIRSTPLTNASDTAISLARPDISQREIDAVVAVLKTPNLSLGPKVIEFEEKFAAQCDTQHAIACNSGTSALHLVLLGMGISSGDEVITTPFSFIASSNCIMFVGATPVFADIEPDTWCIDPKKIEGAITERTKAMIPVDVFGITSDMDAINALAKANGLRVIEDSCEALGATYRNKPAGGLGDAGVFGFYPNKQITTGEGGMVVTDDDSIADLARSIRNQGRGTGAGWLAHERLGYNFRLSDINSAIGCVQLDRLDEILSKRAAAARMYDERFKDEDRVTTQWTTAGCEKSWFVYVVRLNDGYAPEDRNRILDALREQGIACSNYFAPLHLQPFYRESFGFKPGDFPVCEALSERTIALPFHAELSEGDVDRAWAH
ncbi:MAG: DegT/DnrJ/EryC1/StrS family aminotransferase [Planctomycetes bacterium]|nr:DegT/DnrJ/EryC1/StrS family aminotransferase [Planctomycetota bacterium]